MSNEIVDSIITTYHHQIDMIRISEIHTTI